MIAVFERVGYYDSMDTAAIIMEFEDFLKQLPKEEAEKIYDERWMTDNF